MAKELSGTEIANLMSLAATQQTTSRAGGGKGRKKKDPTEPRIIATWWKLEQQFGRCDNEECPDERVEKVEEGKAMVSEVNGKKMCRYCFLGGFNRTTDVVT